jgi:hypothetical protein
MFKRLIPALAGIGLLIGTSLGTTVSGTVTDSTATTPVNNAIVQLRVGNRVLGTDTTDALGAYSITVTDSTGSCSIRTSLTGTYNTKSIDTVLSSAPLTINVAISKIITSTITGVVSDSVAGTPLAGVIVRLNNTTRDTTGADGVYSFTGVRTGNQSIQASLTGFVSKTAQVSVATADPDTANIALVKIVYTKVSGIVKDSAAGTPLSGAIVRLNNNRRDTTGADGAYSFDSVASGTYQIQVSKTNYPTKTVSVTVSSSTPITSDILITGYSYVKVSGIVSDSATGTALAGAVVSLGSGMNSERDTTGADGAFSFDSVRSGNQTLSVTKVNYNNKTVQLTVGSAAVTANVALVAIAYGSISGVVTDTATGLPITGAIVRIGNGTTQIDTTGADGAFSITNVRTGSQTVRASASKYTQKTAQVTVTANTAATANFALVAMTFGAVSGVVTDSAKATPLAGAIVRIGTLIDTTGADGAYSFTEVQTGSQTVQVTCAKYTGKSAQVTIAATPVTQNFALIAIVYGSISGVITDSAKATPLAGAIVRIGNGMNGRVDTTGADGVYAFADVAVGNQNVSVTCAKYGSKNAQVAVADTTPVKKDFALVALVLAPVSGIVTDSAKGTPLAGVEIRIGANGSFQFDTTGADGKYQFAEVAAGSVPMRISASGFAVRRDTLTIAGTAAVTHNIALGGKTDVVDVQHLSNKISIPQIVFSADNFTVTNLSGAGKLALFSLNGKCVYKAMFNKNRTSVTIPSNILSSGLALVAQITVEGKTWTQQILSTK